MAAGTERSIAFEPASTAAAAARPSYALPLALMVALYFSIGFITSLNDILVPHFKDTFHLSNFVALLVQMAFFGAYFVMALPAGWIVGRIGCRTGIVAALAVMGAGLALFVPAANAVSYPPFLAALFVVGSGLALLQVAINPYVGALGSPEHAAARLNLAGGFNSLATTVAPRVGAALIFVAAGASTAQLARSVRAPYMVLAGCAFALAAITRMVPLPELIPKAGDQTDPTAGPGARSAWSFRQLRLGAVSIFAYVGAEVAIGSILISFLAQPAMGAMPHTVAARYVSLYWGGAMVGRFAGAWALRFVSQPRALLGVAAAALCATLAVVFGHGPWVLWAAVVCGLFNSIMWPCIFPLAVAGLGPATSQGSGLLIMMVVGGAVVPALQGLLADHFGYGSSFAIVAACYAWIVFYAVEGYKPARPPA